MLTPEKRAQYVWRCRRGMLELDILLARFIDRALDTLTEDELEMFTDLLQYPDPDIHSWLTANSSPVDNELFKFVTFIRSTL